MLRIQTRRGLRSIEVEREPFLHAFHARAVREIKEQSEVEHDWRGEDRIAAKEVDLDLHRVAEPAEDIDVVPTFFVVTARWVVVDAHYVREVFVQVWIDFGLENIFEH